jgi:hypothetical protein
MKQTRSHKLIYLVALWGFLCGSLGLNLSKADAATSSKQLLTQADFKYIGAFSLPAATPSGVDATFGIGLTHRYVNGELHLLVGGWNPQLVYEVRVPNPSLTAPFPQAQAVRDWGDVTGSKRYTGSGNSQIYGLYWDEPDKRLYWSYGDNYNVAYFDDPSVGYSTLDDTNGVATPIGAWKFTGRGQKLAMGCVFPIPQWFADLYTGGKQLGAGCGGYFSGVQNISAGPALTAFSPPNIATQPDRSSLTFTNLVGYPTDPQNVGVAYSTPDRCHRDTDYYGDGSSWIAWPPKSGIGYWTALDVLNQGGTWIDLPDKHAVMYFPQLGNGHVWYTSGMHLSADRFSHWWYLYDPADLAKVAQGQKQQWEIQPVAEWPIQYPGLGYPLIGGADAATPNSITGVTYDSTTRRLYVGVAMAVDNCGAYGCTKVYVYEVQSGSNPADTTPPAAPRGMRVQ